MPGEDRPILPPLESYDQPKGPVIDLRLPAEPNPAEDAEPNPAEDPEP
jgi:hypothetical protein